MHARRADGHGAVLPRRLGRRPAAARHWRRAADRVAPRGLRRRPRCVRGRPGRRRRPRRVATSCARTGDREGRIAALLRLRRAGDLRAARDGAAAPAARRAGRRSAELWLNQWFLARSSWPRTASPRSRPGGDRAPQARARGSWPRTRRRIARRRPASAERACRAGRGAGSRGTRLAGPARGRGGPAALAHRRRRRRRRELVEAWRRAVDGLRLRPRRRSSPAPGPGWPRRCAPPGARRGGRGRGRLARAAPRGCGAAPLLAIDALRGTRRRRPAAAGGRTGGRDSGRRSPTASATCSPSSSTGRTNRQIAGKLYISEKTVSVHVSNILAKLGVAQPRRGRRRSPAAVRPAPCDGRRRPAAWSGTRADALDWPCSPAIGLTSRARAPERKRELGGQPRSVRPSLRVGPAASCRDTGHQGERPPDPSATTEAARGGSS